MLDKNNIIIKKQNIYVPVHVFLHCMRTDDGYFLSPQPCEMIFGWSYSLNRVRVKGTT